MNPFSKAKAHFAFKAHIYGGDVSFFTPPHQEPDYLWVDIYELADAVASRTQRQEVASRVLQFIQAFRVVVTVAHEGRIATIAPVPFAHGLCIFMDVLNGHSELNRDDALRGPAATSFAYALAEAHAKGSPLDGDALTAAHLNQGGPYMRGER